ncbi:YkvA family protein [Leptotrichia trevisanii]|uniref:YkvA family protein n=1 Tax=Leptotrichia trevisanii TaxID=109328 RepID=UPI000410E31F|nr:YkvA family protein [Leptotrichia trevisanii]
MLKRAKKLYEKYKKTNITAEDLKKAGKLKNNLGAVASKFGLLVRMLQADKRGEFKIPTMDKVKIIGAIIYVISTIDAVPDILPIIGFGDDIGVVAYVISKLGSLISEYEKFELQKKREEKDRNVDWDNLQVVNED